MTKSRQLTTESNLCYLKGKKYFAPKKYSFLFAFSSLFRWVSGLCCPSYYLFAVHHMHAIDTNSLWLHCVRVASTSSEIFHFMRKHVSLARVAALVVNDSDDVDYVAASAMQLRIFDVFEHEQQQYHVKTCFMHFSFVFCVVLRPDRNKNLEISFNLVLLLRFCNGSIEKEVLFC